MIRIFKRGFIQEKLDVFSRRIWNKRARLLVTRIFSLKETRMRRNFCSVSSTKRIPRKHL